MPVPCRFNTCALIARAALCLVFFCLPAPALSAPFAYTASENPLSDLLCAYAAARQKGCSVSPEIAGTITGNLSFPSRDAFFAFLENSRDIISYEDDAVIHYYARSQMETATLPLHRISVSHIASALRDMRAFDPRFPLRPVSNGKMLRLSAPPVYMALVAGLIGELEGSFAAVKGSRVFRLKHAWADDIELEFLNKTTTVPGVATLLRRITSEGANAPAPVVGEGVPVGAPQRLKGQGLITRSGTRAREGRDETRRNTESTGGARILADQRLNAVIVWDDEDLLPLYENLVRELDQPVSLVEIRAAVVDVSVNRLRELGVSWNVDASASGSGFGADGGSNTGLAASGSGLSLTTIYRNGLDVFMSRVHALEEDGDAAVLSRPAVLTLDNIQASLEVTSTYYISVAGQEEVDLFDVTYGTILRVTPHVIQNPEDGATSVKLSVHVEDGNSVPPATNSGIAYPVVSKTLVNTQALVGNGQALIIGGHYYETLSSDDSGIPGLKSLPVLGALFKTQGDAYRKQERLFVISPRVLDPRSIQENASRYEELFDRTMMTAPATRIERTTGGCARQRRVSVHPAPMHSPAPSLAPASPAASPARAG